MTRRDFFLYYLPVLIWAGVIFVASSIPNLNVLDMGFNFQDKVKHSLVYAILGVLIVRALARQAKVPLSGYWLRGIALLLGVLYGISDEFHQSFVPGRSPEVTDVLADGLGVWLGIHFYQARHGIRAWLQRFTCRAPVE